MVARRTIVNSLSLSRIALACGFVICFQPRMGLLYASAALWGVSLTTDLLDGYLARRWRVDTILGRLWDSMGDKSFYAAMIVAFNTQGFLGPLISWALIAREVALYVTRILYSDKLPNIEDVRPWTDSHGYFMHLTLVLGLVRMYTELRGLTVPLPIHPLMQVSAFIALVLGVASIFLFLNLESAPSQ
jgi:phosphatidylglycerophosphate synthase